MAAAGTQADPRGDRGDHGDQGHLGRGGPGGRGERVTARRPGHRPVALLTVSCLVAALLALPLAFLLIEASGAGASEVAHLIFRPLTWALLWNTIRLAVTVTVACAVIGTAAAWCVERTDLPGRRASSMLVVVPLAIPDFVVSFGWHSLWTWAHGFLGAVIVMTLAVYPLVYLPVAASLRMADPGQEEVARSLGVGRVRTFVRITLGQAKVAILGGCLLAGEGLINRDSGRAARTGPMSQRVNPPQQLGWTRWPVLALFTALVLLALGLPVASALYWMADGLPPALSGGANVSLLDAAGHTALYGTAAGALATVLALPVALLAARHTGRMRLLLERSTYLVLGMPGVVIAFALSYFTEKYAAGFGYGTSLLLVACYAIMFFPLALVGVKASLARAPASLDEVARSLGQRRLAVLLRVTIRLAGPGLVAAFCLVFLSAVTELTATLLLIPTGTQTLATQFWAYESNLSYSQAAPFALVMIIVAVGPSYLLGRFFNRPGDDRMNDLTVAGLHKAFGALSVLAGLDLEVPAGSLTAVLGPSGSGKTTLLRLMAGFERADAGTIGIGGVLVDGPGVHQPPERRRIGYVPQEGSLFPHLTVAGNVGFGLPARQHGARQHGARQHGARLRRARQSRDGQVATLLETVGLGGLGRRYPHQLSGGQQQRVALARALAIEPAVVLLDEPFASLDAHLRASIRADVQEIFRRAGTTAVLVTHDQDEALSTADRVAVLRGGVIAQYAPPEAIYRRPVDPGLARFVGEANLLSGLIRGHEVETPLGVLPLDPAAAEVGTAGRVTVLIRPEQLEMIPNGPGINARVVTHRYHGHDAVLDVQPRPETGAPPIVVRVTGGSVHPAGSAVCLRVRGPVFAWPAN